MSDNESTFDVMTLLNLSVIELAELLVYETGGGELPSGWTRETDGGLDYSSDATGVSAWIERINDSTWAWGVGRWSGAGHGGEDLGDGIDRFMLHSLRAADKVIRNVSVASAESSGEGEESEETGYMLSPPTFVH